MASCKKYHFYSVSGQDAGVDNQVRASGSMDWSLRRVIAGAANSYSFIHPLSFALAQMASVTIFLEAYDNAPDWDVLNRVLCQWRAAEERTRAQCDLPSVQDEYPGCFYYQRGHDRCPAV
jgi:hypothetical protein